MRPFLVQAPVGPLITEEDLAGPLHVDDGDPLRPYLASLEAAAVAYLDGYSGRLGRCILKQRWALPLIGSPEAVELPFPDCRNFRIETRDDAGEFTEVPGATLEVCHKRYKNDIVLVEGLPEDLTDAPALLTCDAGWENSAQVHEDIKQIVRFLVAYWFEIRTTPSDEKVANDVPSAAEAMIRPIARVFG